MTKAQCIREHLLVNGDITSWEAIQLYGETRLADKILKLRQKGWNIVTIMMEGTDRNGNLSRYAKYVYKGDK